MYIPIVGASRGISRLGRLSLLRIGYLKVSSKCLLKISRKGKCEYVYLQLTKFLPIFWTAPTFLNLMLGVVVELNGYAE
jgi:hypothetical protein